MVYEDPFIPTAFTKNQKGMQYSETLSGPEDRLSRDVWLRARDEAVTQAQNLVELGVHKMLANRLLEPFCWQTILASATEWDNFFGLRRHANAQPEIRIPAEMMWEELQKSEPKPCGESDWHLPLVRGNDEFDLEVSGKNVLAVCVGRCARISYLTHNGARDPDEDVRLHERLAEAHHMSPFEHPASVMTKYEIERNPMSGNFRGWRQYRKMIRGEDVFRGDGQ